MIGLFRGGKIKIVFVLFVFLMLNKFAVLPIYGVPSTTCNYNSYHTYACEGDSRFYCVRSITSTSSGTSTRYWWSTSNCASGEVCYGGSCFVPCDMGDLKLGANCKPLSGMCIGTVASPPQLFDEDTNDDGIVDRFYWLWNCGATDGVCDSENWFEQNYCGSITCDMKWPGSRCLADIYCLDTDKNRNASDCSSGSDTCCSSIPDPGCEANTGSYSPYGTGPNAYCKWDNGGSCWRCGNGGPGFGPGSSCNSFTRPGTDGVCGGSNGGSVCSSELNASCNPGTAANLDLIGSTYSWKCNGDPAASCPATVDNPTCTATKKADITGVCGTNDGTCSAGTVSDANATTTKSDGIYSVWSCLKQCSGTDTGCEHKLCDRVDGKCHPTNDNSCSAGTVSDSGATTTKSDGIYSLWNCNGSCSGGNSLGCEYKLCNRVDGVCGSPADGCFPPTSNLCLTNYGNTAITPNSNTFNWKCNGTCSGVQPSTCTSIRWIIDGRCGASDEENFTSTPAVNLCAANNVNTPVQLSGTTYSWTCDRNCNGTIANCTAVYDTAPNFSTAVLKNTSGTVIAVEAGGRNHSCDVAFAGSKTSKWTITATDANGTADIKEISLRFRSANTYSYGPTTPVNGIFTFTVDTTNFVAGAYHVEVLIDDQHSPDPPNRGWLDTGRDFYIWDCQVTVDGTIYDNSANLACVNGSNQGFETTIPASIQSFTLAYGDRTDMSTRNMTVVSPRFYSGDTLTWQNQYFLDTINTTNISFLGLFNRSKINDICTPYNDYLYPKVYVDAYSASPRIDIKYSAVMDQEAWFRVRDGSVLAKVEVKNYVPVTCVTDCKTAVNGMVWSKKVNLTDSDKSLTSEVQPLPPFGDYYEDLKYNINGGLNVGTTIAGSVSWSGVGSTRGVIFVGGDLTIDQNMVLGANDYVIFIVKGRIIIANTVTQVNGVFYTDTTIEAMGENDTQLKILGSLYGRSGINLSRSYVTKRKNNTAPAVEVTYDPNLIFGLPKEMWELYENWTLE